MLDLGHLGSGPGDRVQLFTRPNDVNAAFDAHVWNKPLGVTMCFIVCIGGGGGGGGGFTRIAGAAGGGGGSGGSSGIAKLLIPAIFLPDRLWVQVGSGGIGKVSGGGVAGSGGTSLALIHSAFVATNVLIRSNAVGGAPTGGGTGTGAAVGAAGAAGGIPVIADQPLAGVGIYQFLAGNAGAAGGAVAGAVGGPIAIPVTGAMSMGGSGGGGTTSADFAGGLFTAITDSWLSLQRPATPAAGTAGHGSGGPQLWKPLYSFGGGGGSSSNAAAGANGGHGGIGSGGGGGGAGTTGGRGGNGGPGLVAIICW